MTSRQIYIISAALFISFFTIALLKMGVFAQDETGFHYPNLLNFYENGFDAIFNSQYSAANTPLPYIIVGFIAKIFSPTLLVARIVTAIISFFAFLITIKLLELYGSPGYLSFVILFYPYFFVNSFVFYVVNYGLFFVLLSLLLMHYAESRKSYVFDFLAGISLALAVLCQQFYLMIPAAIVITRIYIIFRQKNDSIPALLKKTVFSSLLFLVPLIVPFILFFKWGGLTHPNFRSHSLSFYPSTLVAILFVTGLYFIPYLIQSLKELTASKTLTSLFLSILMVLLFKPVFSDIPGPGIFTGITHHLIAITGHIHPFVSTLVMIALTFCGILVLFELFTQLNLQREYILFVSCVLLAVSYSTNTLIGEKHLLAFMIFLFLLLLPRIRKPMQILYLVSVSLLGIIYFIYWNFFKSPLL